MDILNIAIGISSTPYNAFVLVLYQCIPVRFGIIGFIHGQKIASLCKSRLTILMSSIKQYMV